MPQCVYANFVVGFNGFKSLLKEENVKMVWSTALKRPSVLVSYRTDRRTRQLELRLRSSIIAQFQRVAKHRAFDIKVKLSKNSKISNFSKKSKTPKSTFLLFQMTSKTQKNFSNFSKSCKKSTFWISMKNLLFFKLKKFKGEKIFLNKERINNFCKSIF